MKGVYLKIIMCYIIDCFSVQRHEPQFRELVEEENSGIKDKYLSFTVANGTCEAAEKI